MLWFLFTAVPQLPAPDWFIFPEHPFTRRFHGKADYVKENGWDYHLDDAFSMSY